MFSIDLLNEIRAWEIEHALSHLRQGARILEIGAGTGRQALELSKRGFAVEAIDIPGSDYAGEQLFEVKAYDGRRFPFPDASFDIVYSSNVLEHLPDLAAAHREIRRVLRPGGYAVHVLPTHAWRFWTTLSAFPAAFQRAHALMPAPFGRARSQRPASVLRQIARALLSPFAQRRHGERGTILSELWLFHPNCWRKNFRDNGYVVERDAPMGLFYTGNLCMGAKWDLPKRCRLAAGLGSASHLFVLRPA